MTRQESVAVSSNAVECETVAHAIVWSRAYFELVEGGQKGAGTEDVPTVGGDSDELLEEPDWTLEELRPSINDNVRPIVR